MCHISGCNRRPYQIRISSRPPWAAFLFARRISPALWLYAAFSFALYPIPFQPPLHALQGFTAALQCALFNRVSPKNTPIIKRRKFFKKIFLILLQTCFPTGYKRRTAQQQTPHDKKPAAQQRHGDTAQQQAPKKFQKKIFKTCYKRRSPRGNNRNAAQQRRQQVQQHRTKRNGCPEQENPVNPIMRWTMLAQKKLWAVGVGNRRPHEHIRKSCENVKATDYVMQEMAP